MKLMVVKEQCKHTDTPTSICHIFLGVRASWNSYTTDIIEFWYYWSYRPVW